MYQVILWTYVKESNTHPPSARKSRSPNSWNAQKADKKRLSKNLRPLKIQQTYKGKEINTNSMKNAVLEKFDSNSELVLQVLAKYLPELMAQKQAAWAKVSLTQSSPTIRVAFSEIIPRKLFP